MKQRERPQLDPDLLASCQSWFDVAALCYLSITQEGITQETWISHYFGSAPESVGNPNIPNLRRFAQEVRTLAKDNWHYIGLSQGHRILNELNASISGIPLEDFGAYPDNAITPLYAVLVGIDLACQELDEIAEKNLRGPLNKACKTNEVSVFLEAEFSMVKDSIEKRGLHPVVDLSINGQLGVLRFHELGGEMNCRPTIMSAPLPGKPNQAGGKLRLGMAPFAREEIIGDRTSNSPAKYAYGVGNEFSVSYGADYDGRYSAGVKAVVLRAIEERCDVLVFPELVISPGLRYVVQRTLRENENGHALALVVAGSTAEHGDNVSTIFDTHGNVLGTSHKRYPFVRNTDADESGWKLLSTGARLVERIENPGATCTLVDVPNLGRVLTIICKDMTADTLYASELVRRYRPQLVLCPSLSQSLDTGFLSQSTFLSGQFYAIACICNACGARSDKAEARGGIGMISIPTLTIEGSRAFPAPPVIERLHRGEGCTADKECNGSCLFTVDIDFESVSSDNNVPATAVNGPIVCP